MGNSKKILYVEDEMALAMLVKENLESNGYEVYHAKNGEEALERFFFVNPHIVLLDVMMPKSNGFKVAKNIRAADRKTPILFISAKVQTKDVIEGFEAGGNDYIRKPFSIEELLIRIKVMLSTNRVLDVLEKSDRQIFQLGAFEFNSKKMELYHQGKIQKLTSREAELLQLFCENENRLLNKKTILNKIWGDDSFFNSRSLDVFVSKLRKHLKKDPTVEIINIRGQGYKFLIYGS